MLPHIVCKGFSGSDRTALLTVCKHLDDHEVLGNTGMMVVMTIRYSKEASMK